MRSIIEPAVNVSSVEEFRARLRLVRDHAEVIQVDVVDGIFARPRNVADPRACAQELRERQLHLHIMTAHPQSDIARWHAARPRRITVHVEVRDNLPACLTAIQEAGCERGLAIAPDTPLDRLVPFLPLVDAVLLVSVPPGRSGQRFDPRTPDRLRVLHERWPALPLSVDGGMRLEIVPTVVAAGATSIAVGSAVFDSSDPVAALREFQQVAERAAARASV